MALLSPVGWADVATKHDLAELERRIELMVDAKIERTIGQLFVRMLGVNFTMAALVIAAARV